MESEASVYDVMQRAFRTNQEMASTVVKLIHKDADELDRLIGEPIKLHEALNFS